MTGYESKPTRLRIRNDEIETVAMSEYSHSWRGEKKFIAFLLIFAVAIVGGTAGIVLYFYPIGKEDANPVSNTQTSFPTISQTTLPTRTPTRNPTKSPTNRPTRTPTLSLSPTTSPTRAPSYAPTSTMNPSSTPTLSPSSNPTVSFNPTNSPSATPSSAPSTSFSPTEAPTKTPSVNPTMSFSPSWGFSKQFEQKVVLEKGGVEGLGRGQFVSSPLATYKVGLSTTGDFVLLDSQSNIIWNAGVTGGSRLYLQSDGNLIVRDEEQNSLWSTRTQKNYYSRVMIDDGGQISVVYGETAIWIAGVPRGQYTGAPSQDLQFPIRAAFYYLWYPETWETRGKLSHFEPDLGFYRSDDPLVVESHIDAFEYGNIDMGILSWWGIDSDNDRARIMLLLSKTYELGSQVKWSIYYENEMKNNPTVEMIKRDLDYLKKWFAWHPAFAHIDGKPVIFVYNEDDCDVAVRFMEAANGEWHVVLKLFSGDEFCPTQPSGWHQYSPMRYAKHYDGHSYSVSAGFWHAASNTPELPRLSKTAYCQNVQDMVDSGSPLHLITTFNEFGEGTGIEPSAVHWPSDSGYGIYLDCLHDIP